MFYTAIWCTGDEQSFMGSVPLDLLGESLRRYGSTMPLRTVVLEGYRHLSAGTVRRLEALGLEMIDAEKLFAATVEAYPEIDGRYSRYERNCFLRWLVIGKLLKENGGRQFWHLDSDIILHTSLDEIAEATAGQTFILQGTPAFASAADPGWLDAYERELGKLNADVTGYSAEAQKNKEGYKVNDLRLCNQTLYRNPIGSDQDLLEYLVASGRIPQDGSATVLAGRYYYVQNPLNLHDWDMFQGEPKPARFVERGDREIWYGRRRVPFMHYQNTFCSYADSYLKLRPALPDGVLRRMLRYRLREGVLVEALPLKLLRRGLKHGGLQLSRHELVTRLMGKPVGGEMRLLPLLNFLSSIGLA